MVGILRRLGDVSYLLAIFVAVAASAAAAESPTATVELEADFLSSTSSYTTLTITFSEDPVGFDEGDLILSNGSITAGSYDGSNFTYTAFFTADSNVDATGGVELVAGSYEDAAGNIGAGSSDTADIDTQNPTSTITFDGSLLSSVSDTTTVTITFSEDPVGFDETDLVVSNGILSGFSGHDTVWTATFEAASNFAGVGMVQLPAGSYTDHVNFLNPGVGSSRNISIDTESPTATVDLPATSLSDSNTSTDLTITFTEVPTGFDAGADLTVIGGALGSGSFDATDLVWTSTYTATDGFTGTGSVTLAAASYTDAAGNTGSGNSDSLNIDTPATTPATPNAPVATSGNGVATVTWSKPNNGGSTITGCTVTSSPDDRTCSTNDADTLTCVVTGLTNGTAYTFTVTATNAVGTSPSSSASNSVAPQTDSDGSALPAMPVPLMPAAVLFLLAGLLGFIGVRRLRP